MAAWAGSLQSVDRPARALPDTLLKEWYAKLVPQWAGEQSTSSLKPIKQGIRTRFTYG